MREQARLARTYGVHGFCFYHYWFSGRRILERPADNFLASDIDLPFCLCWANENWTRTWSGDTKSVLLKQDYGHGEEERFIRDLLPYLRDRRYIRVDGKPLLLIYRIKELPEPAASIQKWRQEAARAGLPGLHIAVVDFYDISVPREVGADALVEFPPHKFNGPDNHPSPIPVFRNPEFAGGLLSYRKIIEQSLAKESPDFELYRGIIPNWDNTPRRQNTSSIIVSANPDSFGAWLRYLRTYNRLVRPTDDRSLLFVNAWNEWGEGCHLEPDLRFGLQYLEQVARTSWFDAANAPVSLGEARAQARDALQVADAALAIR